VLHLILFAASDFGFWIDGSRKIPQLRTPHYYAVALLRLAMQCAKFLRFRILHSNQYAAK
jgi:hypothetical protein